MDLGHTESTPGAMTSGRDSEVAGQQSCQTDAPSSHQDGAEDPHLYPVPSVVPPPSIHYPHIFPNHANAAAVNSLTPQANMANTPVHTPKDRSNPNGDVFECGARHDAPRVAHFRYCREYDIGRVVERRGRRGRQRLHPIRIPMLLLGKRLGHDTQRGRRIDLVANSFGGTYFSAGLRPSSPMLGCCISCVRCLR